MATFAGLKMGEATDESSSTCVERRQSESLYCPRALEVSIHWPDKTKPTMQPIQVDIRLCECHEQETHSRWPA